MRSVRKSWRRVNIVNHCNTDKRRFHRVRGPEGPEIARRLTKRRLRMLLERQSGSIPCFTDLLPPRSRFLHRNSTQVGFYVRSDYHAATKTGKETTAVTRSSKITQDLKIPRPRTQRPRVQRGQLSEGRRGVLVAKTEYYVDGHRDP